MKWISANGHSHTSLSNLSDTGYIVGICNTMGLKLSSHRIKYLIQFIRENQLLSPSVISNFETVMLGDRVPVNEMMMLLKTYNVS